MTLVGTDKLRVGDRHVEITRLGFGCARLFHGNGLRASARLIEAALRAGIRHFDTAPSYGSEESERVLGEVLAGVKDATVATKFGLPYERGATSRTMSIYRTVARPLLARAPAVKGSLLRLMRQINRPTVSASEQVLRKLPQDEVLRSLEASLARLKRDRIDLFLAHEPDQMILDDDLADILMRLQRSDNIGEFGLAWDRVVSVAKPFGRIIQSRFDFATSQHDSHTRIFHGVLRHSSEHRSETASERIATALSMFPSSVVLFSASHPSQIEQLMEGLQTAKSISSCGSIDQPVRSA